MPDEEEYTREELEAYGEEIARQVGGGKDNSFSFFTKIIQNDDTTRIGNVSQENLGNPQWTLRSLKELELFCKNIKKDDAWSNWFKGMAEITTSTSLSREGFLVRASQTQKKELADVTPKEKKPNKGWFKSKKNKQEE